MNISTDISIGHGAMLIAIVALCGFIGYKWLVLERNYPRVDDNVQFRVSIKEGKFAIYSLIFTVFATILSSTLTLSNIRLDIIFVGFLVVILIDRVQFPNKANELLASEKQITVIVRNAISTKLLYSRLKKLIIINGDTLEFYTERFEKKVKLKKEEDLSSLIVLLKNNGVEVYEKSSAYF